MRIESNVAKLSPEPTITVDLDLEDEFGHPISFRLKLLQIHAMNRLVTNYENKVLSLKHKTLMVLSTEHSTSDWVIDLDSKEVIHYVDDFKNITETKYTFKKLIIN